MDLSVFLGALSGFVGGLALDRILNWWAREERRHRFRSLIAHELVRNLTFIARVEDGARKTEESGYNFVEFTSDQPRVEVLKSILTAGEVLMSLSEKEQTNLIEVSAHIDKLNAQYEGWIRVLRGESGQLPIREADGTMVSAKERSTRHLFDTIDVVRGSHMLLLALALALTREAHLIQPVLRQLKAVLRPTVRGWGLWRTVDAVWASPPPADDRHLAEWEGKPVVVWTRGPSTYSGELIELRDIIGD